MRGAVFALCFAVYGWTAAPAPMWLDSSEFVAASASLGIPHPPGHPVPTLVGRAFAFLPLGDVAWRVNLAAAAAGALVGLLVYVVAARLARRSGRAGAFIAAAAALAFAASGSAWQQAVRAEVYALEAALALAVLALVLAWNESRDGRTLAAAGLLGGLALATHHYVTLTVLVPAAAVALARRPSARIASATALLGILGLAAFAYLPLRAARDPEVSWGDPDTLPRFAWTVSARAFQKTLAKKQPALGSSAAGVAGALARQATLPVCALAAAALALALARRRDRRPLLLLAGVLGCGAAGRALLGFDDTNPDAHGYLLPALAALLALAAAGTAQVVASVPDAVRRAVLVGACAAAATLPILQTARFAQPSSLRGAGAAESYGRAVLGGLPPGALLVTAYNETLFQVWALRALGDRPDVVVLDRGLLSFPYEAAPLRRRFPDLAALIDELHGGAPIPPGLAAIARRRPVAVELGINLWRTIMPPDGPEPDDPALRLLVPVGPVAWLSPDEPSAAFRARAEEEHERAVARLEAALATPAQFDRHGAARLLTWDAFLDARFYCSIGRRAAAAQALERARRAGDPDDPAWDELARACP